MIWREKRVLLTVLGILLLANTVFFFTYRVQYQSRLDALDTRLEDVQAELANARHSRVTAERTVQSYRKIDGDVLTIFNEHWSTQRERLTPLIGEVKRLAEASGMVPATYAFAQMDAKQTVRSAAGTVARRPGPPIGAREVGVSFTVEGTYEQVRRLINLLELSRQFIIIDGISLSGGEGNQLTLTLQLKTLFRDDELDVATNRL